MTDAELIKEFIRIERAVGATSIQVRLIEWNGPAEPVTRWETARKLAADVRESEVEAAVRKVLEDEDYFSVCAECKERNPVGWMLGGTDICQKCGSDQGVVF